MRTAMRNTDVIAGIMIACLFLRRHVTVVNAGNSPPGYCALLWPLLASRLLCIRLDSDCNVTVCGQINTIQAPRASTRTPRHWQQLGRLSGATTT